MADLAQLSKRQRQILDIVYAHGEATISQVLAEMPDAPTRGALRTLLRIMEQKGHIVRRQDGKKIVYRPTERRGRAARSALGRVLDVFFNGSMEKALSAHLSEQKGKLDPAELQRLAELIDQAKRKGI